MDSEVLREHKKISDEIDDAYMAAVAGCTDVQVFLSHPQGNPNEIFFRFYAPFFELFQYTYQYPDMKSLDKDTITKMWDWFQKKPPKYSPKKPDAFYHHINQGLKYFQKYQGILMVSAVININRK